jgi:hypothetical protein
MTCTTCACISRLGAYLQFADQEDFKKIVPKALSGELVPPLQSQWQRRAQPCSLISLAPLLFLFRTVALSGSFTVLAVFQFGG